MTSIEWLENEIKKSIHYYRLIEDIESKSTIVQSNIFEQAKEIHKQEMKEMYLKGIENYDSTFKRKDDTLKDYHIVEANEMVEFPKQEISDEEIEEMLFHHSNEYAIGFKDAIKWYREQLKSKQ
jgi:hypothetical protein